jgi:hypothetical protein
VEDEYNHQRAYLERTVDGLKTKARKDGTAHRADNLRVLHENTALLKEVNELRRELKALKGDKGKPGLGGALSSMSRMSSVAASGAAAGGAGGGSVDAASARDSAEARREAEMQRELIASLREQLSLRDSRLAALETPAAGGHGARPMSRERLPPLEVPASPQH